MIALQLALETLRQGKMAVAMLQACINIVAASGASQINGMQIGGGGIQGRNAHINLYLWQIPHLFLEGLLCSRKNGSEARKSWHARSCLPGAELEAAYLEQN